MKRDTPISRAKLHLHRAEENLNIMGKFPPSDYIPKLIKSLERDLSFKLHQKDTNPSLRATITPEIQKLTNKIEHLRSQHKSRIHLSKEHARRTRIYEHLKRALARIEQEEGIPT